MKILDRYISLSIVAAFFSGVAMFMALLCAMDLMKKLIELIAEKGVPVGMALAIFAYQMPGMLVYAFPMAVLMGILLTFGRMSSESEMVAIRAAGISFVRVVLPTLFIALLVTGFTFWISNVFAPYASKRSDTLLQIALAKKKTFDTVSFTHQDKLTGKVEYTVQASEIEYKSASVSVMRQVEVTSFQDGMPVRVDYAPEAEWDHVSGHWIARGQGFSTDLDPRGKSLSMYGNSNQSQTVVTSLALVQEGPLQLSNDKTDPATLTADEIRANIAELRRSGDSKKDIPRWATRLAQRYATPFTCLVFALIGAPLGLRHHRTSSAVGLGVSLLVIFAYYFFSVYLSTFGDSGTLSPLVAAWAPNVVGAILGVALIVNANR